MPRIITRRVTSELMTSDYYDRRIYGNSTLWASDYFSRARYPRADRSVCLRALLLTVTYAISGERGEGKRASWITCQSGWAGCAEQLMNSRQHVRKRTRARHVRQFIVALRVRRATRVRRNLLVGLISAGDVEKFAHFRFFRHCPFERFIFLLTTDVFRSASRRLKRVGAILTCITCGEIGISVSWKVWKWKVFCRWWSDDYVCWIQFDRISLL